MAPDLPDWQLVGDRDALRRWVAEARPPDDVVTMVSAWMRLMTLGPPPGIKPRRDINHPKVGEGFEGAILGMDYDRYVVEIRYWVNSTTRHITCGAIRSRQLPEMDAGDREDST